MSKFLFFCEGSPELGFGHVGRCLALAVGLRDDFGRDSEFVFRGSDIAASKIREKGFPVHETDDFNSWQFSNEPVVILDLLIPLEDDFFMRGKCNGVLFTTIDDPTPNRLKCDMAFYPPVPQVKELAWDGFNGDIFQDWQYIPLRKEFGLPAAPSPDHIIPELLITMGGSDPKGLTVKVLRALLKIGTDWTAKVIAGPMFNELDKIRNIALDLDGKIELLSNVSNMAELMRASDLAVASFGMTAYELAACGVPQILLCLSDDHARSASALHHAGAAISLGRFDLIAPKMLVESLNRTTADRQLRLEMTAKALTLNIGNGVSNICTTIIQRLEQ